MKIDELHTAMVSESRGTLQQRCNFTRSARTPGEFFAQIDAEIVDGDGLREARTFVDRTAGA